MANVKATNQGPGARKVRRNLAHALGDWLDDTLIDELDDMLNDTLMGSCDSAPCAPCAPISACAACPCGNVNACTGCGSSGTPFANVRAMATAKSANNHHQAAQPKAGMNKGPNNIASAVPMGI